MKKYFLEIIILPLLVNSSINSQTFITNPFITIPGNNFDIDVINAGDFYSYKATNYLCWVNQKDSNYSIYLKRISVGLSDDIKIYSINKEIVRPELAIVTSNNSANLRIVWQMKVNNYWQIFAGDIINDSLAYVTSITDSVSNNTEPTISSYHVAWINNGNILYQTIDSLKSFVSNPIVLEYTNCSNPALRWHDDPDEFFVIYEKGNEGEKRINSIGYAYARFTEYWFYDTISSAGNNINPHLSTDGRTVSYQTFINGYWKAVCAGFGRPDTSENVTYNCENPDGFYYPVFTKRASAFTPSFMVYDSDSLNGNKEIFFTPTMYYIDSTINISHAIGDDYEPRIAFYRPADTTYIAVFWIHDENGKKDIWMAKSVYNPNFGDVKDGEGKLENFALEQNYPNPFNPTTTIKYVIPKSGLVQLKVYDALGREAATLVNEFQSAGEHSKIFNTETLHATSLPSGIYFYQLKSGEYITTKKMILLK